MRAPNFISLSLVLPSTFICNRLGCFFFFLLSRLPDLLLSFPVACVLLALCKSFIFEFVQKDWAEKGNAFVQERKSEEGLGGWESCCAVCARMSELGGLHLARSYQARRGGRCSRRTSSNGIQLQCAVGYQILPASALHALQHALRVGPAPLPAVPSDAIVQFVQ